MASYHTKNKYKYCVVPECKSTTASTPDKYFFRLPTDKKKRTLWQRAMRRDVLLSEKTGAYCCQDHFNIEEDMENYIRFKLMGGTKKMKPDVVPHIFDCQSGRKRSFSVPLRAAAVKRAKKENIDDAIASTSIITTQSDPQPQALADMDLDFEKDVLSAQKRKLQDYLSFQDNAAQSPQLEDQDQMSSSSSQQTIDDIIKIESDAQFQEVDIKLEPLDTIVSLPPGINDHLESTVAQIPDHSNKKPDNFELVKDDETAETECKKIKLMFEKEEEYDEDLLFFKSLLPDFKLLPRTSKMALRIKFQQLIYEETLCVSGHNSS